MSVASRQDRNGTEPVFKKSDHLMIMSLWQVPDKQTSLLMTTFYQKWLEGKMAIPEAFLTAQTELRETGLDPYYWAGFVLVE